MLEKLRCLALLRRPPDRTNGRRHKNLIGESPALSTKAAPGTTAAQPYLTRPIQAINPVFTIVIRLRLAHFIVRPASLG
jgi:hypothetical protein